MREVLIANLACTDGCTRQIVAVKEDVVWGIQVRGADGSPCSKGPEGFETLSQCRMEAAKTWRIWPRRMFAVEKGRI
jgi:hypothetical protein